MPDVGGVAGNQLRSVIERVERLESEKREIAGDIKETYAEAKGNGLDVKTIRRIVRERRRDGDDRAEEESIYDLYMRALGEFAGTPLGAAAMANLREEESAEPALV